MAHNIISNANGGKSWQVHGTNVSNAVTEQLHQVTHLLEIVQKVVGMNGLLKMENHIAGSA
jgi:hypothetical protein